MFFLSKKDDAAELRHLEFDNTVVRVVDTDTERLVLAHADENGQLHNEREVLAAIVDADKLIVCYPKQVGEQNPQLRSKLVFPESDKKVWISLATNRVGRTIITIEDK